MRAPYFFILAILIACNSSTENTETETRADSTAVVEDEAGFSASRIQASGIPETIVYEGKVQDVYRWQDKSGDNIFFVSVKGPFPDNDKGEAPEEGKTAQIFAVHYLKDSGAIDYRAIWRMKDQELSCPLDITTELVPGSLTVTDLDKNGVGEVKFQYALACRSDVSPASMKLVMEESGKQYSLTGSRWVEFSPDFKFDVSVSNVNIEKLPMLDDGEDDLLRSYGRYKSEKEFATAPPAFIEYARNEWIKYAIETFKN